MNAALIERLQAVKRAADAAGHGGRTAVYQQAASEMGISLPTLHRKLKDVTMPKIRKRRADAGNTALTLEEARIISAYLMESQRKNGKRLSSLEDALDVLRSNGMVIASRVHETTGEAKPLSVSAVSRALQFYKLHPDQLARPTPKTQLKSAHPNHVWQIDPSLCVLYYLPAKTGQALQVMPEDEFYKNKPANIRKIENERVWRYVITDHASGWVFVHYVLGAETGKNLVDAFVHATQRRHESDPVHGVPFRVMVDPGSANTGAIAQNLWRTLDVQVDVNKPGQPWAKGQVEKGNDIVERSFEHRLKFLENPPTTVDEINEQAGRWMRWFNSTKIHRRTGKTRYDVWMQITADQLRIAPDRQTMLEISISNPVPRKVTPYLTVEFDKREYDVADVPVAMVGETIWITRNPWRQDGTAQVMYEDAEGRQVVHIIEPTHVGKFGFADSAAMLGEQYKAKPDSQLDKERKEVNRIAMNAASNDEAGKARKKKATPFGGAIDPMKPIDNTRLAATINKRGTAMDIKNPVLEIKPLTHVQAAKRLADRMSSTWQGAPHFSWLQQHYADGVPEEKLPQIEEQLRRGIGSPMQLVK